MGTTSRTAGRAPKKRMGKQEGQSTQRKRTLGRRRTKMEREVAGRRRKLKIAKNG
jgi:hypothetical protein